MILAATAWPSNAELIADIHQLGYLRDTDHTLDPTYGQGTWWKTWRPEKLTAHHRAADGSDFRHLPHPDGTFDVVAYDPPYVCPGGRATSTIADMHDRYGMNEGGCADPDFTTPDQLQQIINDGLTEMARLVQPAATRALTADRPNGIILVKCKDYIWSGRLHEGVHHTRIHAERLGLVVEDRLEHIGRPGPQSQTRQVHARRNLSTLLVLRRLSHAAPTLPDTTIQEAP